jgi:hypothetical protein
MVIEPQLARDAGWLLEPDDGEGSALLLRRTVSAPSGSGPGVRPQGTAG